jgi:hypothetical protein
VRVIFLTFTYEIVDDSKLITMLARTVRIQSASNFFLDVNIVETLLGIVVVGVNSLVLL